MMEPGLLAGDVSQPWFDPATFGAWVGALGGGIGGTLAGCLGAAAGIFAPRGRHRRAILGGFAVVAAAGGASLVLGIAALALGQPYAIWFPPLLPGVVLGGVGGALIPAVRRAYERAERRRLDAAGLRRG